MARTEDTQLGTAIPEADRLEQEQHADPTMDDHGEWPVPTAEDVDQVDRLEQAQAVVGEPDEEYPPDQP